MSWICGDCLGGGDDNGNEPNDEELEQSSTSLRSAARDCNRLAKETSELCISTVNKSKDLVEFGQDIKDTLVSIASNMDAEALDTIRDLIDGDKVREARSLAGEMDDLALQCIRKCIEMVTKLQQGVDALPDRLQRFVEHRASKIEITDEERALTDIEPDVTELQSCIRDIEQLNLFTAMKAGRNAFNGIANKAGVCTKLFEAIKKFALAIASITDAMMDFDIKSVISKIKDILRCINLSNLMKQMAEQVGKLIKIIIDLFQKASGKLGKLWSALAYAKDRLKDCLTNVVGARDLCFRADDDGDALIAKSRSIGNQLSKSRSVNSRSIASVVSVVRGKEIREAIELATNMDDMVTECTTKVGTMIEKVTDGYENLPDIITDGIPDMREAGTSDDDPDPANVEEDIADLQRARSAVENADVFGAITASVDGFAGVADKVETSRDLIKTLEGFAENCTKTIESFMGVWDLEAAMDKIMEMCRLVKLGEMMKQFAAQVKNLLKAVIDLMRTIMKRLNKLDFPDVADSIQNGVGMVTDLASSLFKRR